MVQNRNLEGTDMDMSTNKQLRPFGMRDKVGYAFGFLLIILNTSGL